MHVSESSRTNMVTEDGFGYAARCAESLRLSESESFNFYRGSASAAVRGIASPEQHDEPFPERLSLSAHQAAEPPRRLYKHFVPPGRFNLALAFVFLSVIGCQTNKTQPVALAPEDMCSYCKMAISEKQYAA